MPLLAHVRGSGTPVLLLHGLTIDHRMMLPLDAHFGDGSWERHYVDLPGSGGSDRLPFMSTETVVDSVSDYIETTMAGSDFALVGISFGGFVARALHARYGDRVLGSALLAPAVKPAGSRRVSPEIAVDSDSFELDVSESEAGTLASFTIMSPLHTRSSWAAYLEHIAPGYSIHDWNAAEELLQNYRLEPFPESAVGEPLGGQNLVIAGKQDTVVGWRDQIELLDFYRNQSFVALDRAGHNLHLDQPRAVGHLIEDWLQKMTHAMG